MTWTADRDNFKIFCIQKNFRKQTVTGFSMEIRGYFCVVIKDIEDEIHMDDLNGSNPEILFIVAEHAIGHGRFSTDLSDVLSFRGIYGYGHFSKNVTTVKSFFRESLYGTEHRYLY
jgi:hypothetical protein